MTVLAVAAGLCLWALILSVWLGPWLLIVAGLMLAVVWLAADWLLTPTP